MTVAEVLERIETINTLKEIIERRQETGEDVKLGVNMSARLYELLDVYEFELRNSKVERLGR